MKKKLTDQAIARLFLGDMSNRPVEIVPGRSKPCWQGSGYYFTTLSGKTVIDHPNSYNWPMWYHASTRRIVVGRGWLAKHRGLRPYKDGVISGWTRPCDGRRIHGFTVRRVWGWYENWYVVRSAGRPTYHVAAKNEQEAIRATIAAWRKQDDVALAAQVCAEKLANPYRVWVGVDHARASGYCEPGIEQWCKDHELEATAWHRGDLVRERAKGDTRIDRVIANGYLLSKQAA